MAVSEFELIRRYFESRRATRSDVVLGIGDDAALLSPPEGMTLVTTVDMLLSGRHFTADADPVALGHKALAVNLSDLAAMAATPAWATLALALPAVDEPWLDGFCQGLFELADRFGVQLIGGDTTRGPLTICIQASGFVPEGQALRRDGARPGDRIMVTGTLGDAALALAMIEGKVTIDEAHQPFLQSRLDRPEPRIDQAVALRDAASAAIDISDGLTQDLGHILTRSGVGARLNVDRLPHSAALADSVTDQDAVLLALAGGDDYELCITVPPDQLNWVQAIAADWSCGLTEIGVIEAETGLRCVRDDGSEVNTGQTGYDHFI